jgi:hypothetical protein
MMAGSLPSSPQGINAEGFSNELLSIEAKRRMDMAADASVEIETDPRLDRTGALRYEAY